MRIALMAALLLAACNDFDPRIDPPGGDGGDGGDASDASDASLPSGDASPLACLESYPLEHGGHRYMVGEALAWWDAELDCESEGGHLVVIDDEQENQFVAGVGSTQTWIGASDHRVEGTYLWVTGSQVDDGASFWDGNEPNNSSGREDCVELRDNATWNDQSCQSAKGYVCECDGVAPASPATWCVTGTDDNCDVCGDDCGADSCSTNQTCV